MSKQATSQKPNETPIELTFLQMVSGYWISQAIYVAAKLGIADLLNEKSLTAGELAKATATHPETLYRLLRGLSSVGIFSEGTEQQFTLTPLGAALQSGKGSIRALAIHLGETPSWRAWGELLHSVQTGETAFVHANGAEVFPYYGEHPESKEPFDAAMTEYSETVSEAVTKTYDFSHCKKIVDVGGGHAGLLSAILKTYANVEGVVFDQPATIEGARRRIEQKGLEKRCEVAGGDFFQEVPTGGDAYILKAILHDWDDERALSILKNIHRAMQPGGKLLLVETVIPANGEPSFSKLFDLHMLVMTGGRERTEAEYAELLRKAGFRLNKITTTEILVDIVEAERLPDDTSGVL
jgi:ubiquinone/menaquinone biosynthesis C-methylase UbiE